jgi:uncharacterized protein (DUF1800 family)
MQFLQFRTLGLGLGCLMTLTSPAWAASATLEHSGKDTVELGTKVWFLGKVDGTGVYMNFAVNGIPGGNATVGKINSQNGQYDAPAVLPSNKVIVVTGTTTKDNRLGANLSASSTLTLRPKATPTPTPSPAPSPEPKPTPTPTPTPAPAPTPTPTPTPVPPVGQHPAPDAATVSATRLLEQATFGATAADVAAIKANGQANWLAKQFAMPASAIPVTTDMKVLQNSWYQNMASGQDQLRQRMIFALSQLFVVSADKNPYANEIQPWLVTLSNNAFGNFNTLLREMSLNPSMGKYLDLGNSVIPAPNENYAREVMQLFTLGPVLLNQDGSVQTDRNGDAIPTYDQARIGDISRALSGWTYAGTNATGINWENFSGPLQPRDKFHDKSSKTLLNGAVLPAGQSTVQDFDGVMQNLFQHPNLPPFIATRLIRAFVTSNPSPAYITRVADVFAYGAAGRGDLKATLTAVLTDPEARQDQPTSVQGHLKDPMLQSIGLFRTLNATVVDPTNLFWDYFLMGQKITAAPSVFNFYSPMTRLPGNPQYYGPEFQLYAPALAVARANFLFKFISGEYKSMVNVDISPFVAVAGDTTALLKLVDTRLLAGRMTPAAWQAIAGAVAASSDPRQRAITALYLAAISAEFAVAQ